MGKLPLVVPEGTRRIPPPPGSWEATRPLKKIRSPDRHRSPSSSSISYSLDALAPACSPRPFTSSRLFFPFAREGPQPVLYAPLTLPLPSSNHLSAPRPGQRPYDQFPQGFGLTAGALEAGLRFPLHPVIEDCLRKWGISPSQMAPNSWLDRRHYRPCSSFVHGRLLRIQPNPNGVQQRHWGKWVVEIRLPKNRTRLWLGTFDAAEDATLVYDREAFKLRVENARLNFPNLFLCKGGGGGSSRGEASSSTLSSNGTSSARIQATPIAGRAQAIKHSICRS
ncbi:unnamed protein product [Musa acuminata subsp. burmannicoides]